MKLSTHSSHTVYDAEIAHLTEREQLLGDFQFLLKNLCKCKLHLDKEISFTIIQI